MRALVNSANQVVNRYAYRPFGMHESVSEQVPNPLRYNAREFDPTTGLYYYRARWYDPAVHRFLSEDPAAEGTNLYAYVGNDPVNYTDPTGMYQQPVKQDCDDPITPVVELCPVTVVARPTTMAWVVRWLQASLSVGGMTLQWSHGFGPVNRTFGEVSIHTSNLRASTGVEEAVQAFCSKNPNGRAEQAYTNPRLYFR